METGFTTHRLTHHSSAAQLPYYGSLQGFRGPQITILSDSQAAIRPSTLMTSRLVLEYYQTL